MPDGRSKNGGARSNSGPKPRAEIQLLREVMEESWSASSRKKCIRATAILAENGDANALKVLLSYSYGTPPSGDEIRVREEVAKQLDSFIALIRARLDSSDADRILSLLFAATDADASGQGGAAQETSGQVSSL